MLAAIIYASWVTLSNLESMTPVLGHPTVGYKYFEYHYKQFMGKTLSPHNILGICHINLMCTYLHGA